MAEFSKLKKRGSLGAPPTFEEASHNLTAPETAPVMSQQPEQMQIIPVRIDGRSARKTNRILHFATKITPEHDARFRAIAARENIELAALLEKMIDKYEADRN